MNTVIADLEGILKSSTKNEQKKLILAVYNQIVPGPRGRIQSGGTYKDFMDAGTGNPLELVGYVYNKLVELNMGYWADRVKTHYHIHDEHKGQIQEI